MEDIKKLRESLKSNFSEHVESDQKRGVPFPPLEKASNGELIDLPDWKSIDFPERDVVKVISERRSRRNFTEESMSLAQLSWLLWATQGVHEIFRQGIATRRTVPSAGARHPFETYVFAMRVLGLAAGIYRYLPIEHKLALVRKSDALAAPLQEGCLGQPFAGEAAATFAWTAIPYRSEWRYPLTAHKIMLLDAGHICQNMYIAAESIGCGTCAVAAYDQDLMDKLIGVDGIDEFTVYVAPVGKPAPR
jgi:SagB-type dehydrogenase family enzyme